MRMILRGDRDSECARADDDGNGDRYSDHEASKVRLQGGYGTRGSGSESMTYLETCAGLCAVSHIMRTP